MIEADAIDYIFFVTCIFTDILIKYDLILYICLIYCNNLKERRFHRLYPPVQCLDLLLLGSLLGLPHCHISWLSDKLFTCCWYAGLLPLVLLFLYFWGGFYFGLLARKIAILHFRRNFEILKHSRLFWKIRKNLRF